MAEIAMSIGRVARPSSRGVALARRRAEKNVRPFKFRRVRHRFPRLPESVAVRGLSRDQEETLRQMLRKPIANLDGLPGA